MSPAKPPVIIVTGPTASGKNKFALQLALEFGGEIVNADSVQVYKDFDIGAAKPSAQEFAAVPHHLYSYVDPREEFNVARFREDAINVIENLHRKGIVPILVGGSGLYVRTLVTGLVSVDTDDAESRERLLLLEEKGQKENKSPENFLFEELKKVDPHTASKLHARDKARIRRALLVYYSTGTSLGKLQERHGNVAELPFRTLILNRDLEREELYRRIDRRVEEMIACGLVEEVQSLLAKYSPSVRAFSAIGYRHVSKFLKGEIDLERMSYEIKRDTRRYAKRQLTWWRNQPARLGWLVNLVSEESLMKEAATFIKGEVDKIQEIQFVVGQRR